MNTYKLSQREIGTLVCKTFTMLFSKDPKNWTTSKNFGENPSKNIADVSGLKTTCPAPWPDPRPPGCPAPAPRPRVTASRLWLYSSTLVMWGALVTSRPEV